MNAIDLRSKPFWIGLVLLAVTIVPLWVGTIFPSLDGPVHVYIADVLRKYDASAHLQGAFRLNPHVEPNLLIYPILYVLKGFFDGPTSEKLLLTLIGCAFFTAAVYAVRSVHPGATWLAVLFLPATYLHPAYAGFYNYTASLTGFLFGLGYWFRHRHDLHGLRILTLAGIALLVALAHLVGVAALALTVCVTSLVMACAAPAAGQRWGTAVTGFVRSSAWLALAFLPAALLIADFFVRYGMSEAGSAGSGGAFWRAQQLVTMSVLYLFDPTEALWNVPFVLTLAYLGFLSRRTVWRRPPALGLLTAMAALTLIYFAPPLSAKGVTIHGRILPLLLMLAILTCAACYRPEQARRYLAVVIVGAAITLASGASRAWHHARIDRIADDYLSISAAIGPNSNLIAFHDWRPGQLLDQGHLSWRVDPFRHLAAELAVDRDGVFLGASLLSTRRWGFFPVNYRDEVDFYLSDGWHDLRAYNRPDGRHVDYVVLWPVVNRDLSPFAHIREQMGQDYQRVATSSPLGLAHLYRYRPPGPDEREHRGPPPAPAGD